MLVWSETFVLDLGARSVLTRVPVRAGSDGAEQQDPHHHSGMGGAAVYCAVTPLGQARIGGHSRRQRVEGGAQPKYVSSSSINHVLSVSLIVNAHSRLPFGTLMLSSCLDRFPLYDFTN